MLPRYDTCPSTRVALPAASPDDCRSVQKDELLTSICSGLPDALTVMHLIKFWVRLPES